MAEKLCQQTFYIINFIPSPSLWTEKSRSVSVFFARKHLFFLICVWLLSCSQMRRTRDFSWTWFFFLSANDDDVKKNHARKSESVSTPTRSTELWGKEKKKYHKGARPRKTREKYALSVLSIDDSHQLVLQEELHLGKKVCATHLARTWWLSLYTLFFVTFRVFLCST